MKQSRSYTIKTFASNVHREVERLEGQLDLFWSQELAYYRRIGLVDGMTVLDGGSGPGHLMLRLKEEFPGSRISGIEIDPVLVEISRDLFEKGGADVTGVTQGSILSTGFDEDQFDFIISRLVLEHLPEPVEAVKEVKRILKPGGVAVFVANDFAFHPRTNPNIPELADVYRAYCTCRKDEGGNPHIGRELPQLLHAGGLTEINVDLIGAHNLIVGDKAFLKSEGAGISTQLIRDGYLDKDVFDRLIIKWRDLLATGNHSIFRQLFYCSGKKPEPGRPSNLEADADSSLPLADHRETVQEKTPLQSVGSWTDHAAISDYLARLATGILESALDDSSKAVALDELGVDSLSAATMQACISDDYGVELSIADFFNGQTIDSLSHTIAEQLGKQSDGRKDDSIVPRSDEEGGVAEAGVTEWRRQTDSAVDRMPLSYNQQSLWFLHQLDNQTPAYHVAAACRIKSPIDEMALEYALERMVERHPALRTTYHIAMDGMVPEQYVHPHIEKTIETMDGSTWSEQEVFDRIQAYYRRPFDLDVGPVFRCCLIRLDDGMSILMVVIHHIACDAWSISIFFDELMALYMSHRLGEKALLREPGGDYADYVSAQRALLAGEAGERLFSFWKHRISCLPQRLTLPYDYPRPTVQQFTGASIPFNLDGELYQRLNAFSKDHHTTLYSVLLSVFQILLMAKSGQTEFLLGTISSGRTRKAFHNTMGYFVNPVLIPGAYRPSMAYFEYLKEIRESLFSALDHQSYPFAVLVEKLATDRDADKSPMFQVMFNMLSRQALGAAAHLLCPVQGGDSTTTFGDLEIEPYLIPQQEGQFDMTLEVTDTGSSLFSVMKYNTSLFKKETPEGYIQDYRSLIEVLLDRPDTTVGELCDRVTDARLGAAAEPPLTLAISSTFTIDLVEPGIRFWMQELDIAHRTVFAPYNQVFQQLLDVSSSFYTNKDGINVIVIRFEDWMKTTGEDNGQAKDASAGLERVQRNAADFLDVLSTAVEQTSCTCLVFFVPLSPQVQDDAFLYPRMTGIENELNNRLKGISGVYPVSAEELHSHYPVVDYYEPMGEELGHIPYTQKLFDALATLLARKVYSIVYKPYKVIVLDCDNTLWRGVVGEDGVLGVRIDPANQWLQEFILDQYRAGMVICLCSKNDEADVIDVLKDHPDMRIRENHIAAHKINWLPKSENIKALARELNLGLDSFIFIDDNPVECAEVQASFPEVLTIQLPGSEAEVKRLFANIWAFDHLKVTEADANRSDFYRSDYQRDTFRQQTTSFAGFIEGLNLEIGITDAQTENVPRISQLTQRVNQFNLTTIRRSESDIERLRRSEAFYLRTVHVADRFGDYGLVGVLIAKRETDTLQVDSFILSCRALGKGVEHAMAAHAGQLAQSLSLPRVRFSFSPTRRNKPAKAFLDATLSEFSCEQDDGWIYELPTSAVAAIQFQPVANELPISDKATSKKSEPPKDGGNTPVASKNKQLMLIAEKYSDINHLSTLIHPIRDNKATPNVTPMEEIGAATPSIHSTATEFQVSEVWLDVLKMKTIRPDDRFFEIGGKSVLMPQIVIQLKRRHDIDIRIVDIFQYPTIRSLSAFIERQDTKATTSDTNPSAANSTLKKQQQRARNIRRMLRRKTK